MKKLLNSSKDWVDYKNDQYKNKHNYIQSEDEKNPTEYPCMLVETKWFKGCESADDQFVRFVYINDFPTKNIRKEKIMEIEL